MERAISTKTLAALDDRHGPRGDAGLLRPEPAPGRTLRRSWSRYERQATSPGSSMAIVRMIYESDVRSVLPAINVPTLVIQRTEGRFSGRPRAIPRRAHPGRDVRELPGRDVLLWAGDQDAVVGEIQEFLTGRAAGARSATACSRPCCSRTSSARPRGRPRSATRAGSDCSASTIASCDASSSGSAAARSTPPATASSPRSTGRPARSAARSRSATGLRTLGLEVRAGLHTGEIELRATTSRARGPHRRADRGPRRRRRGPRLEHGQGPRRRIGPHVRGPRDPGAEGGPGGVAALFSVCVRLGWI